MISKNCQDYLCSIEMTILKRIFYSDEYWIIQTQKCTWPMRAFYFQKPSMDDNYINNHSFSLINPAIKNRITSTILLICQIVKKTKIIRNYNQIYFYKSSLRQFRIIMNYIWFPTTHKIIHILMRWLYQKEKLYSDEYWILQA